MYDCVHVLVAVCVPGSVSGSAWQCVCVSVCSSHAFSVAAHARNVRQRGLLVCARVTCVCAFVTPLGLLCSALTPAVVVVVVVAVVVVDAGGCGVRTRNTYNGICTHRGGTHMRGVCGVPWSDRLASAPSGTAPTPSSAPTSSQRCARAARWPS